MPSRIDQFKIGPQHCGQRGCIVSHDRQPAASFRAVQGKGADDDMSSGLNGLLQPVDIGPLGGLIRQEMKCSTVMPQIVSLGWLPGGDISNHPFNASPPIAKTLLGRIEGGGGEIQDRNLPDISVDQGINES
jgi:hypothetical protein